MHCVAAVCVAASLSGLAVAQEPPSDPIAAIEGRWVGQFDDYEVEVSNGVVTLLKPESGSYKYLPKGTVLARLNRNGEVQGDYYHYTGSQCLSHDGFNPPARWKFEPCGNHGAMVRLGDTFQTFNVSGHALVRPKDGNAGNPRESKKAADSRGQPASAPQVHQATLESLRMDAAKRAAEAADALRKSSQVDEHIKQMIGKKRRACSMTGTACPQ